MKKLKRSQALLNPRRTPDGEISHRMRSYPAVSNRMQSNTNQYEPLEKRNRGYISLSLG